MKRTLISALFLAGCASAPKSEVKSASGYCGITEPQWASAARDYDRHLTLEQIAGLSAAAQADRDQLHTGARGDVGNQLDQLYRQAPSTNAFVKGGVAELGTRLRQLDCAVQRGNLDFNKADALYGQIIAELAAERATLDPGAGTVRSAAP